MTATTSLLGQGMPIGSLVFSRRPRASGSFSERRIGVYERSELAMTIMTTVAATLRAETTRGAIRCALWINETETLDDRIDLVIAEIEQGIYPQGEQRAMTGRTLRAMRTLLSLADNKGDIYDTLWLADRAPCKLCEYLDLNIELLEQQRGQRPVGQGAGGHA